MNPTASPRHWPYREHRNMAQVMGPTNEERINAFVGALTRTCPKCGAEPGRLCTIPSGRPYGGSIHNARRA